MVICDCKGCSGKDDRIDELEYNDRKVKVCDECFNEYQGISLGVIGEYLQSIGVKNLNFDDDVDSVDYEKVETYLNKTYPKTDVIDDFMMRCIVNDLDDKFVDECDDYGWLKEYLKS